MSTEANLSASDFHTQFYDIVDRMLAPYGKTFERSENRNALSSFAQPFDVSRPNEHDSKAEFQLEYDTVSSACEHLSQIIDLLIPSDEQERLKDTQDRLAGILSQKLKANSPREKMNDGFVLIRKMVSEAGGYTASAFVLLDLYHAVRDRLIELEDQQDKFWNLPYRAPDFYARAIALRLAKFFCQHVGEKPSYGTSGITGAESTAYSRAVKELFDLLGIKGNARTYSEWAVDQLTENDLSPARKSIMGAILGYPTADWEAEIEGETLRSLTRRASQKDTDE